MYDGLCDSHTKGDVEAGFVKVTWRIMAFRDEHTHSESGKLITLDVLIQLVC